jgi:hypothetical protein
MIEKIALSNVASLETNQVSETPESLPDLPKMIEEENVRDALSMSQDVLSDLAESIRQADLANSPDADRGQGRIGADILDLVSS